MGSVASELKSEREKRNISLAQIAADTHISLRYLESLEEGRYSDLPGGMYTRAFLRAYCEALNLNPQKIIELYEQEALPLFEKLPRSKAHIPPQNSSLKIHPIFIWGLMLIISAIGLFFSKKWISEVFYPYFHHAPANGARFERHEQHIASSAPTVQPEFGAKPPPALPGASAPAKPAFQLELIATDKCWISIYLDGKLAMTKVLEPREAHIFDAAEKFWIEIGNAGGIRLKINGKPLRQLGLPGEVRRFLIDPTTLPDLLDMAATKE
jgi:transcriptional regulator with XRE-family HTH domain